MFRFGCSIGVWFTVYSGGVDDVGLGVKVSMCVCVCVCDIGYPKVLHAVLCSGGGMGEGWVVSWAKLGWYWGRRARLNCICKGMEGCITWCTRTHVKFVINL